MEQGDIVSFFHLQMPRRLFTESKYIALSLEAKVAYTFLLDRFLLSRMNGWVNEAGEVFIVFTREALVSAKADADLGRIHTVLFQIEDRTQIPLLERRTPSTAGRSRAYCKHCSVVMARPKGDKRPSKS